MQLFSVYIRSALEVVIVARFSRRLLGREEELKVRSGATILFEGQPRSIKHTSSPYRIRMEYIVVHGVHLEASRGHVLDQLIVVGKTEELAFAVGRQKIRQGNVEITPLGRGV